MEGFLNTDQNKENMILKKRNVYHRNVAIQLGPHTYLNEHIALRTIESMLRHTSYSSLFYNVQYFSRYNCIAK